MKPVTLQLHDTGSCRHPEAMTRQGASWRPAAFPALVGLIRHPDEGLILFDTGYDPLFHAATRPFPERLYRWVTPPDIRAPIADHLADQGVDTTDIGHVILSHFHGDHASALRRFPQAIIHCARAGLASVWGRGRIRSLAAGMPTRLLPERLPDRSRFFEDRSVIPLPSDLAPFTQGSDLLGDNSLIAVPLPGHCPGHWGLLLNQHDRLHFLVADAAWSSRAIRDNRPPPRLTSAFLGDSQAGRSTLNQLHLLHRRNPDLLITPSHCAERAEAETR